MNIIKAYGRGFKNSLRHPKMILLIFAITLLLGLSLALPFYFSFGSAVGSSAVNSLDYTTFTELQNFHSWNLDSILGQARFTVLIFWLLMIFFVGGIVRTFNKEDFSVATFFSGAGVNFFRFLLCDVIMLVAQVITALMLFGITSFVLSLFDNVVTETPLFWAYGIAGFIFACSIVLLLMISDYAKFYMEMAETSRVFKAIGKATKYVFNNFLRTYFLYALLLVAPLITLILYKLTFDKIGMNTMFGIIAMFFVQQLFILLRVWYRVWSLSSQFELYADDYVQVISYELDTTRVEKELSDADTIDQSIEKKAVVINSDGDTFVKVVDDDGDPIEDTTTTTTTTVTTTTTTTTTTDSDQESYSDNQSVAVSVADTEVVSESESETEVVSEAETEVVSVSEAEADANAEAAETTENVSKVVETVVEEKKVVETVVEEKKVVEEVKVAEDKVVENEPETEEQLSKFYQQDQGESYQSNLADLTPDKEADNAQKPENEPEKESTVVEIKESSDNEPVKESADKEPVNEPVTIVINDQGDTFTKIVDSDTDSDDNTNTSVETVTVTTTETTTNVSILGEPIEDSQSNDSETDEPEEVAYQELSPDDLDDTDESVQVAGDYAISGNDAAEPSDENTENADVDNGSNDDDEHGDVDEEMLSQFYAHDQDGNQPEVIDMYDMDESLGSSVSLDVEDDDDDNDGTVTSVTTTTTTTTTTTVVTETSSDPDEPKVMKIYTEQEMKDIARQQLEKAGVTPDLALTEVVSEDSPEGVISGEMHEDEEFVEFGLSDGEDFNDPDSEAFG